MTQIIPKWIKQKIYEFKRERSLIEIPKLMENNKGSILYPCHPYLVELEPSIKAGPSLGGSSRLDEITSLAEEMHAISSSEKLRNSILSAHDKGYFKPTSAVLATIIKYVDGKMICYDHPGLMDFYGHFFMKGDLYPPPAAIKLPNQSGYAVPFTQEKKGLESVYDVMDNRGFPRKTVQDRTAAEKLLEKCGIDRVWASYFKKEPLFFGVKAERIFNYLTQRRGDSLVVERVTGRKDGGPLCMLLEQTTTSNGIRSRYKRDVY